jgi:hypothetical protein
MRKLVLLLAILIVILIPTPIHAQDELHLSLVSVDIWPEYDQPAVLMIYRVTLAPETRLPVSLSLRIPSGMQINAVAVVDPIKGLINTPYDNSLQGQWSVIKLSTNSLQVQVEYYAPLVKDGITRHVVFEWPGDYVLDTMEVNFLRPLGAESVTISQAPIGTSPGQDGLTNYRLRAVNLPAGQSFILKIDYQRNTDALSISSLSVQAVTTPGPDTPGHITMTGVLPLVLAGIGMLLIVAGVIGFVVWQRGAQGAQIVKAHVPRHEENEDEFIYCHQCGKRAQPGDVFCRTCGTRLKKGSED